MRADCPPPRSRRRTSVRDCRRRCAASDSQVTPFLFVVRVDPARLVVALLAPYEPARASSWGACTAAQLPVVARARGPTAGRPAPAVPLVCRGHSLGADTVNVAPDRRSPLPPAVLNTSFLAPAAGRSDRVGWGNLSPSSPRRRIPGGARARLSGCARAGDGLKLRSLVPMHVRPVLLRANFSYDLHI